MVLHKGKQQNTEVIEYINAYIVNKYHVKYVTQKCTKVYSNTQTMLPVGIQVTHSCRLLVHDSRKV